MDSNSIKFLLTDFCGSNGISLISIFQRIFICQTEFYFSNRISFSKLKIDYKQIHKQYRCLQTFSFSKMSIFDVFGKRPEKNNNNNNRPILRTSSTSQLAVKNLTFCMIHILMHFPAKTIFAIAQKWGCIRTNRLILITKGIRNDIIR